MASCSRAGSGTPPLQRPTLDPLLVGAASGRSCRASSTTCRSGLRIALGDSSRPPAAQRRDVEVVPGAPHLLVAAVVDEVGAEHAVAVAVEHVRAMPLVHAESASKLSVRVDHGISQPIRAFSRAMSAEAHRDEDEGGVTGVQVGDVGDLVRHHGAAPAAWSGRRHPRLEEDAVDDQLTPTVEQVEQTGLAAGPSNACAVSRPSTAFAALSSQGVTGAGLRLFLHQQVLAATSHACGDTTGGVCMAAVRFPSVRG